VFVVASAIKMLMGSSTKPIALSLQTLDARIYLLVILNPQPIKMMALVYIQRTVVNATTLLVLQRLCQILLAP
jgi:hypothetical protein